MINRKSTYGILISLFALVLVLRIIIFNLQENQKTKVIFLDVGQGDTILISKGSNQILIDGGKSGNLLLEKLGKYIPFWDRKIELMAATHPDADHIEGLIEVLRRYKVEKVFKTEDESESKAFSLFMDLIAQEKAEVISAIKGTSFMLSDEIQGEILYPFSEAASWKNSNDGSIVIMFNAGNERFLLTGDLPISKEKELVNASIDLKAEYLKAGHHGSKYSTGEEFLQKVDPQKAVISVGKNNAYGHPNQEVLDEFQEKNIEVLRTDEKGDVVFECIKNASCRILEN